MDQNPFIYGRPVSGLEFVDRQEIIKRVFSRLRNGESVAVTGDPHTGKTSFLKQLLDKNTQLLFVEIEKLKNWNLSYLDLHDVQENKSYTQVTFWSEALKPLQAHPGNRIISQLLVDAKDSDYSRQSLRRLFSKLFSLERQLVLLLDEFECLLFHENFKMPGFFGLLRSLSTDVRGIVLVISSRSSVGDLNSIGHDLGNLGSPFFNQMTDEKLGPFDTSSIHLLLDKSVPPFSVEEKIFIQRVAGRNPYLLQAMAGTLYDISGENRIEIAANEYYQRVGFHYRDVWNYLNDTTCTVAVMLATKLLDGRALGNSYNYGEIENVDRFDKELWELSKLGLAELIAHTENGWIIDRDDFLLWRGEKWALGSEAFAWWIRDEIIAQSRDIPSHNKWLYNQKYLTLITQKQWDDIQRTAKSLPSWAVSGVAGMARSLWQEIINTSK